jgi:hypothetical protein
LAAAIDAKDAALMDPQPHDFFPCGLVASILHPEKIFVVQSYDPDARLVSLAALDNPNEVTTM